MARRRDDEDDDEDRDSAPKPKPDAYVGLMILTLVAVLGGCVLMYLDHEDLNSSKAQAPTASGAPAGLEYVLRGN